jgi:hypothetical protein
LGDLAAADPGGNWASRPSNSLTTILLPWLPQTCATTEKRHAAVRVVAKQQPEIGWKLVFSLLPEAHSVSSGTRKPIWQPFIREDWKEGVLRSQYDEDILAYAGLALELAGRDVIKLAKLVKRYFRLPPAIRACLRERLTSDVVLGLSEAEQFRLWAALTKLTANHRKFADHENWKVPERALEELDAIADRLRPSAPEIRHKRLFAGVDVDLYETVGDWEEQRKKLDIRRQEAVRDILSHGGITLLLQFAADVEASWQVGYAFASLLELARVDVVLPPLLETDSKQLLQFAGGYVWGRHKVDGWNWVDSLKTANWSTAAKAQFFTFLPFCKETWSRVERQMESTEGEYWQKTSANPYESSSGIEQAISKLINYGRADAAIQCMHLMARKAEVNPDLALRALNALNTTNRIDDHAIGELITALQGNASVNEQALRQVELKFLRILGEFYNGRPISLSRWMAEDPEFFCEVIRTVFRSTKEEENIEPSEEVKERAGNAYHLLYEWRTSPGAKRDGSLDPGALTSWINAVKTKCVESGHWEVAATKIGKVLFYAPLGEDGLWIEPVCAVLDEKDHSSVRSGLTTEIFNSRGVFTFTAGKEEMELAEKWGEKASLVDAKGFSRLGQDLRRLADSYRRDAEREAKENPFEAL